MKGMAGMGVILLLIVGGMTFRPVTASCEPARGWYLNGGLGVAVVEQPEFVNPEMETGLRVGANCGFRFNPRWAIEFESGLTRNGAGRSPEAGESVDHGSARVQWHLPLPQLDEARAVCRGGDRRHDRLDQ
jgi:hypothetical protein